MAREEKNFLKEWEEAQKHYSMGDLKNALEKISKAISYSPSNQHLYFFRGQIYMQLELYELALEDMNQLIRFNPNNYDAYFNSAVCLLNLKRYEYAIEDFKKVLENNELDSQANHFISRCYRAIGDEKLASFHEATSGLGIMKDMQNSSGN